MKLVRLLLLFTALIYTLQKEAVARNNSFSYDQTKQSVEHTTNIGTTMNSIHDESSLLLRFLYKNFFGTIIRKSLSKKWFSSFAGWYCNRNISKCHIKPFIKEYRIDIDHAEKSIKDFSTFNDFFIRKLKPEARPIDAHPHHLISPADGKVIIMHNCTQSMKFPVKQSSFNLERFLGSKTLAQAFEGGTLMIFRLAPYDYHRFHFPLDCIPLKARIIHGRYESVNPLVYYTGIQPLTENERHLTLLLTKECGPVALVSVGALCVGKIIETYTGPNQWHKKGAEAGYFCFGGSTVVLIFKKGTLEVDPEILKNSQAGKETPILMGKKVAKTII